MFKKYFSLAVATLCITTAISITNNAFAAVPIFSSADVMEQDWQEIEITPASSVDNSAKYNALQDTAKAAPIETYSQEATKTNVPLPKMAAAQEGTPVFTSTASAASGEANAADVTTSAPVPTGGNNEIQNSNFKNAIQNLDGAQVGIRENLTQYTAQYNDAKMRFDAAKQECKTLKKQIKAEEKRIKDVEKAKKTISLNIAE